MRGALRYYEDIYLPNLPKRLNINNLHSPNNPPKTPQRLPSGERTYHSPSRQEPQRAPTETCPEAPIRTDRAEAQSANSGITRLMRRYPATFAAISTGVPPGGGSIDSRRLVKVRELTGRNPLSLHHSR